MCLLCVNKVLSFLLQRCEPKWYSFFHLRQQMVYMGYYSRVARASFLNALSENGRSQPPPLHTHRSSTTLRLILVAGHLLGKCDWVRFHMSLVKTCRYCCEVCYACCCDSGSSSGAEHLCLTRRAPNQRKYPTILSLQSRQFIAGYRKHSLYSYCPYS